MFKYVVYETWVVWIPCVAFAVTVAVFSIFLVHAIRLHKSRAERLANLPLE